MNTKKESVPAWARAYYEAAMGQTEATTTTNVGAFPVAYPEDPIAHAGVSGICPFTGKAMSPRCNQGLKAYLRKHKRRRRRARNRAD